MRDQHAPTAGKLGREAGGGDRRGRTRQHRVRRRHPVQGAVVVVMASINAFNSHPRQMLCMAVKHATPGIVRAASRDLGRFGIRVNGLAPRPIATAALLARIYARSADGVPETEALAALAADTALGRLATAQEIAKAALFLASDMASGIAGELLPVDPGFGRHSRSGCGSFRSTLGTPIMNATDIKAVRTAQVAATIERIRAIEQSQGVTRESLDAIKAEMLSLARHEHLFPSAEFPPPAEGEKASQRYLLQADNDHRFALYLTSLNPGNETRPHDHTTWAVIVSVEGQEHNKVYGRVPGGLVVAREVMVEPGTGIALMPDDIHAISTPGSVPTRHLHMYGLALEVLDDRKGYDPTTGEGVPYNKNFMRPTAVPVG